MAFLEEKKSLEFSVSSDSFGPFSFGPSLKLWALELVDKLVSEASIGCDIGNDIRRNRGC